MHSCLQKQLIIMRVALFMFTRTALQNVGAARCRAISHPIKHLGSTQVSFRMTIRMPESRGRKILEIEAVRHLSCAA